MHIVKPQDIERKKGSLRRYKKNLECIERLENRLNNLAERIESVRSPNYSGMPRGGTPVSIEELLSDKIELEKRIERLKKKSKGLKDLALEEIDSLEDVRYCEILEAHFIDGLSISEISEEMGYSERYVFTLYKEALRLLTRV